MKIIFLIIFLLVSFVFPQDLWKETGDIFTDQRLLSIGEIIHIHFEEGLIISYQSTLNKLIQKNTQSPTSKAEILSFLPSLSLDKNQSASSEFSAQSSQEFSGSIAARIVNYQAASKVYTIEATQSINIEGSPQTILLRGLISRKDLSARQISSSKIANTQIFFQGNIIKDKKKFLEKDFINLFNDEKNDNTNDKNSENKSQTNTIKLATDKKKQIFLDFFNLFLNELF